MVRRSFLRFVGDHLLRPLMYFSDLVVGEIIRRVQPHDMGGIDAAFQNLEIIAFRAEQTKTPLLFRNQCPFEFRESGLFFRISHVGPDDSTVLYTRVTGMMNGVAKLLFGGNVRHLHATPVSSVLPAMIRAAYAIVLDATEIKRRQAVLTIRAHQTDLALTGAEQYQIFAKKPDAQRLAARFLKKRRRQDWNPILPEQISHQSSRSDPRQPVVFLFCECQAFQFWTRCHGRLLTVIKLVRAKSIHLGMSLIAVPS